MSKLVTTRYESVVYDDASGALTAVPPTYPTVLDQYTANSTVSAGSSYGVQQVSASGNVTVTAPPGAQMTIIAAAANTTNIAVLCPANVVTVPGSTAATNALFTIAPGQTVSFPGVWNVAGNTPYLVAVTTANAPAATTAYSAQILWSL